jgi:hypothetical protein
MLLQKRNIFSLSFLYIDCLGSYRNEKLLPIKFFIYLKKESGEFISALLEFPILNLPVLPFI